MSEEQKEAKRQYSKNRYNKMKDKLCYCWFNREMLLKNAWDKYHNKRRKRKAAKYYDPNQEVLRKDARNKYRNLSEREKNKKKKCQREKSHTNTDLNEKLKQYQRNYYASKK